MFSAEVAVSSRSCEGFYHKIDNLFAILLFRDPNCPEDPTGPVSLQRQINDVRFTACARACCKSFGIHVRLHLNLVSKFVGSSLNLLQRRYFLAGCHAEATSHVRCVSVEVQLSAALSRVVLQSLVRFMRAWACIGQEQRQR